MSALATVRSLRDDFRLSSWLALGAALQLVLSSLLPLRVAIAPALLLIFYRTAILVATARGLHPNTNLEGARIGKYSAQIPRADGSQPSKPADEEVVVFILGAQFNHANGRFVKEIPAIKKAFEDMWKEAESNCEKWGFLGTTPKLLSTDRACVNSAVWISYWKSVDQLHAFAQSDAHRKGMDLFARYNRKSKALGIMHELYHVPKQHWEAVYYNYNPFAFGATKHAARNSKGGDRTRQSACRGSRAVWQVDDF